MSCHNEIEKTQSVPTVTTYPNQQKDEGDVVSVKDGIPSDLKSSVTSSGDITAGFTGGQESETSIGVQNGTVNDSVTTKSNPDSSGLAEPKSLKSTESNGNLTRKLLKAAADIEKQSKMLNKASHLHSNFTAGSFPRTNHQMGKFSSCSNPRHHGFPPTNYRTNERVSKGSHLHSNFTAGSFPRTNHQMGKFSSCSNPGHHGFPPTNYRTNERVSKVNDRSLSRDKFRSEESEISMELTHGPRVHYHNSPLESPAVKDEFAITVCRDTYNLSDFQTEYETAKFYVIKSFNEDDIHKCIKHDVWASTSSGNKKLNAAFHDAEAKLRQTGMKCPVFLFFSVNASGQFVGVAEMFGPVDFKKTMKFWKHDKYNGFFPVRWHIIKDVPNNQFLHIIHESSDNRPVTFSRDTQEIGLKQGLEMLNIFKSYSAKTSLLDDFDFYEKRDKLFRSQKSIKHKTPEQEVYGNNSYQNTVKAGGKKTEMQSTDTKQVTLVNLTKNLSLNPSSKRGFRQPDC